MNPLRQKIEHEIRQRGPIPFSRYMELCLYEPEHGYYSRNAEQFGKAGDFYTSSDVHAVFGRLMARQFEQMWQALDSPDQIALIELGPGRGLFAQDVLDWSEKKFPTFFQAMHYTLVETSPALRHRIDLTLGKRFDSGKATFALFGEDTDAVVTDTDLRAVQSSRNDPTAVLAADPAAKRPNNAARGARRGSDPIDEQAREGRKSLPPIEAVTEDTPAIVFANEFFDALPVEILSPQGSLRIDTRDGKFLETWVPSSSPEMDYLDRHSIHPEPGERLEAPLIAQHHTHRIASSITRGFLIAIDYGYTREEQIAGRHRGTLKALRHHSLSNNPYEAPGEQDITADVNFTALAAVAQEHGMQTQKLLTQSQFLMGIGEPNQFADAFEDCRLPQEHAKVALQMKHLVTPAGMGESFHVLLASKEVENDKVTALGGLTFGHNRGR